MTVDDVNFSTTITMPQSINRVAPARPRAARSNLPVSQQHPCIGDIFDPGQKSNGVNHSDGGRSNGGNGSDDDVFLE